MLESLLKAIVRSTFLIVVMTLIVCSGEASAKGKFKPVQASIVVDADSGEVLHASAADATTYPASLTKMMTLYMVFDQIEAGKLKLSDRLKVSAHGAAQSPSKLGLQTGQSISVEDAIYALVTKSANDVAATVAENLGGSEAAFAGMMTRRARQLGMSRTTFKNASGLPHSEQVTTARDMATLGRSLLRHHARHYHYFSARRFDYQGQTISTHNRLMLRYEGADGIKTGYIHASGFNLVSSAKRDGRRLIGVVLGGATAASRDKRMATLLDAAFNGRAGEDRIEMASATSGGAKGATEARTIKVARAAAVAEDETMSGSGDAESINWGVQIGAFKLKASAENAAASAHKRHAGLLGDGRPMVTTYKKGKSTIYRARIMGVSEDQARSACKKMSDNRSCMVIQPGV